MFSLVGLNTQNQDLHTTHHSSETVTYQPPGLVVVQVNEGPDVALASSSLCVHELLRLLVAKLHVVAAAAPLPLGPVARRG